MAGDIEKGLSNSMWAPGRPYRNRTSTRINTHTENYPPSSRTNAYTENYAPRPPPAPIGVVTPATTALPCHVDFQSALNRIPTPWAELARHNKIVRRLNWKLPFLGHGYNAATDRTATEQKRGEAELMFKLDFFEYYMLIERALVHLLGVFGVKITGAFGQLDKAGNAAGREHRFHANVLDALSDYRNPLHEALGKDDVRLALARAKELRNRWKNADEPDAIFAERSGLRTSRPLEEYDLDHVLQTISVGFVHGLRIAEQYVAEVRALAAERGVSHNVDMDQPDEWEFMTEAMDWEAV